MTVAYEVELRRHRNLHRLLTSAATHLAHTLTQHKARLVGPGSHRMLQRKHTPRSQRTTLRFTQANGCGNGVCVAVFTLTHKLMHRVPRCATMIMGESPTPTVRWTLESNARAEQCAFVAKNLFSKTSFSSLCFTLQKMLDDPALTSKRHSRETIDSRDKFSSRLYKLLGLCGTLIHTHKHTHTHTHRRAYMYAKGGGHVCV